MSVVPPLSVRLFLLFSLPVWLASGCVTMGKYHALKDQVALLEENNRVAREQLETLTTRVENLKTIMDTEDEAIRVRVADLTADYGELQMTIGTVQGKQEEIDFTLNAMAKHIKGLKGLVEDRFGVDSDALPADLPEKPEELFQLGQKTMTDGLNRRARAIFKSFIQKYPAHEKTDDAQFMVGETLLAEERFTEAVNAYKTVYDQYQTGDRYPEAVLRIGHCYVRSNKCDKALKIYQFAKTTFKGTETAKTAEEEIKKLKSVCK